MNKTITFGIIIVIAVIGGLFYMMNQGSPVPTQSPSNLPTSLPTQSPTPTVSPDVTMKPPTPAPASTTHTVTIQSFAFSPSSVTIKKGDTVVWTNNDSVGHTVTGDNGGSASPTISPNGTYSFKFNTIGTFNYHCSIHPSMTGTVTVTQ